MQQLNFRLLLMSSILQDCLSVYFLYSVQSRVVCVGLRGVVLFLFMFSDENRNHMNMVQVLLQSFRVLTRPIVDQSLAARPETTDELASWFLC